jgi:hypothetical protein
MRRYRANWKLTGLKGRDLKIGDTIELTEDEAEPYVGDRTGVTAEDAAKRFVLSPASDPVPEPEHSPTAAAPTPKGKGKQAAGQ